MNSLFSDFFMECWRGILGSVRDYLEDILGGFSRKNEEKIEENYTLNKYDQSTKSCQIELDSQFSDQGV